MSDEHPEGETPDAPRRRLPKLRFQVNWARLVIVAALLGGVWAIAHYVAVATMEGDCQAKVSAARADFRKEQEKLSAEIASIRAEVATKTALAERRGKANRELQATLRKAREDVTKAERALREAEETYKSYYDKMPEACRMKSRPTPRPGADTTAPAPTPAPAPAETTPGRRIPTPTLRPRRPQ